MDGGSRGGVRGRGAGTSHALIIGLDALTGANRTVAAELAADAACRRSIRRRRTSMSAVTIEAGI
jgi:hypothetical protein